MKSYYRIMLGQRSVHATEAHNGNFIGAGWLGDVDLKNKLPDNWREFNKQFFIQKDGYKYLHKPERPILQHFFNLLKGVD